MLLCPGYQNNLEAFKKVGCRTSHTLTHNDSYEFKTEKGVIKYEHVSSPSEEHIESDNQYDGCFQNYHLGGESPIQQKFGTIQLFAYGRPGPEEGWLNHKNAKKFENWLEYEVRARSNADNVGIYKVFFETLEVTLIYTN